MRVCHWTRKDVGIGALTEVDNGVGGKAVTSGIARKDAPKRLLITSSYDSSFSSKADTSKVESNSIHIGLLERLCTTSFTTDGIVH